jgi:rare lipoprotein A
MPVTRAARLAAAVVLFLPISQASARDGTTALPPKGADLAGKAHRIKGRRHRPRESLAYDRVGIASWYGAAFHGRRTASGETYDMHALTAAHRTLPLATVVRVSNLDNGRSVTVRINDRGPFIAGRIIDLSRAGARALGFAEQGTARVRVAVVRDAGPHAGPAEAEDRETEATTSANRTVRPAIPRRPGRRRAR